ncbi:uncharacterized protein C15orf39 homolog [Taeniopygia guttata]|uniref:uncharacterized protein C15orf39 homolog n=1 Tax=Taeniopygia guttata TaxID=59729 RepID=UPI003BB8F905
MASKRYSQPADPVILKKLPRLEPATGFLPRQIPGTCSPVPHLGSESHFSYTGSYFACPLQSPKGPEQPPAGWSPTPAYLHYGPGALSQPVPAEGPLQNFLLCPPESLDTRLHPLDSWKSTKSLVSQDQLRAKKKLDSPRFPLAVKKPVVVKKAVSLAVPKPVYGAPASFLAPRMALLLGKQAESLQQQPGQVNWALPPATHPLHPSEPHRSDPCTNHSLLLLPSSLALPSREQLSSPTALPQYCVTFDKHGPPPSTLFLEASYPSDQSQKKMPEVPWPKLQLPDSSQVMQERSAMCYPSHPYLLSPHRAGPLCHPPAPTAGEPSALPSFGYVASREPFPSTYLKPQDPSSYFPSPLEPHVPRTVGARLGAALRDAEPGRDAELPRNTGYPGFAVSLGDASTFHASFPGTEPGCEQHGADSPQWRAAPRHSSAFQPVCTPERLSGGSGGLAETFPERGGSWEKPRQREEEHLYQGRRNSSPAPQDTPHGGPGEGNACKVKDAAKELIRPSLAVTPVKGLEELRDTKALSSSPPMPVIHNVFSLAPYQEYLERAKVTDPILFCRKHLWEDSSPQNTGGSQEPAAVRDVSVVSSLRSGSDAEQSQEESCYGSIPKKPKAETQELESQEGSPDRVGTEEPSPKEMVLDLSFKNRLVEAGDTQSLPGFAEGALDREDKEEKEATGGKVGSGEGAQPRVPEADSGDKSSFQSSANFMFQKYKLLPSLPPSTEPTQQDGSSQAPQPSPCSSTPTPAQPASSPSSTPLFPQSGPQLNIILAPNPPQIRVSNAPSTPVEEKVLVVQKVGVLPSQTPPGQYFTSLHTLLCDTISGSVSRSSPELLQEWLKKAELAEGLGEMPKSLPSPKNGSKAPIPQKPSNGKEIWLAYHDVGRLLTDLLSQLKTFMSACPFPHVVRAGAIFIPIHVVKEKLFPTLPGSLVDQVLQKHKVELRPTTLSEERHLRDLELKSCTSRMLKLLAIKWLREIYPDLLNLHWHNSIRQQLGLSSDSGQPSK